MLQAEGYCNPFGSNSVAIWIDFFTKKSRKKLDKFLKENENKIHREHTKWLDDVRKESSIYNQSWEDYDYIGII